MIVSQMWSTATEPQTWYIAIVYEIPGEPHLNAGERIAVRGAKLEVVDPLTNEALGEVWSEYARGTVEEVLPRFAVARLDDHAPFYLYTGNEVIRLKA